jgi:hypothetical protein
MLPEVPATGHAETDRLEGRIVRESTLELLPVWSQWRFRLGPREIKETSRNRLPPTRPFVACLVPLQGRKEPDPSVENGPQVEVGRDPTRPPRSVARSETTPALTSRGIASYTLGGRALVSVVTWYPVSGLAEFECAANVRTLVSPPKSATIPGSMSVDLRQSRAPRWHESCAMRIVPDSDHIVRAGDPERLSFAFVSCVFPARHRHVGISPRCGGAGAWPFFSTGGLASGGGCCRGLGRPQPRADPC